MTTNIATATLNAHTAALASTEVKRVSFGPPVSMDVDMLDPESMLAFFGQQMSDLRGKLGTAMRDQEIRNKRAERLEGFQARLQLYAESGINPAHPDWEEFKKFAEAVKSEFPEGSSVYKLVDRALQVMPPKTTNETCANIARSKGATVKELDGVVGDDRFLVTNEYYGLDKNGVQSLTSDIKAASSAIQSDNALNMINIQRLVEQSSQLTQMCSNIMKKLSEMSQTAISNIK